MSASRAALHRAAGWSDPAFGRVADVVHLVSGLVFPPNRQPSAEAGMRRAMTALHIAEPEALGLAVRSPGEARDAVLAELTVGETYFFREGQQLGLLASHVLPALADRRGPGMPLRIWSAGCASGEEPYTIAIMLRELGWPHPARILGTDVAQPRLGAARRGRYTRWALRGVSPERIDRWFERRASHFQLAADIRAMVEFLPLNLVADEYPSAATGTADQDVVLCRNVLIYFDMETVARIATRLLASLAPDGWLLLGASDPPLTGLVPCEAQLLPGGLAYRRARAGRASAPALVAARPPAAPWWISAAAPDAAPVLAAPEPAPPPAPAAAAPSAVVTPPGGAMAAVPADAAPDVEATLRARLAREAGQPAEWVRLVRAIADQGRLREADVQCTIALDLHRGSPELHYLHGVLLAAAGQPAESVRAARRALYLDPGFVMAHLLLGDALAATGEPRRAIRAFGNAIEALDAMPGDSVVDGADGVSPARLRHVAELRARALREAGA